jgi:hypothetical protein
MEKKMKRFDMRILWGGLLILAGGLFFLQELNLIPNAWDIIWGGLFVVAGGVFLYAFFNDRSQWWTLIPGLALLSLGVIVAIEEFFPGANWTGAILLGGLGIGFWVIYLLYREHWWAIIPGGTLVTLAVVAGLDDVLGGDADGAIFMFGLGITFVLVALLPNPQGKMTWAFIPAAVLVVIGLFTMTPFLSLLNYVWPIALILLGGYFIVQNFRS